VLAAAAMGARQSGQKLQSGLGGDWHLAQHAIVRFLGAGAAISR